MTLSQKFNGIIALLIAISVLLLLYLFVWMDGGEPVKEIVEGVPLVSEMISVPKEGVAQNISSFEGRVIAGETSFLLDAHKDDVKTALDGEGTVIFYFYSKWCTVCKKEIRDALVPAFEEVSAKETIGFQVNWDDRDVEPFEKELAQNYGIASQHTKVIVKQGQVLGVFTLPWTKEEYRNAINQ